MQRSKLDEKSWRKNAPEKQRSARERQKKRVTEKEKREQMKSLTWPGKCKKPGHRLKMMEF